MKMLNQSVNADCVSAAKYFRTLFRTLHVIEFTVLHFALYTPPLIYWVWINHKLSTMILFQNSIPGVWQQWTPLWAGTRRQLPLPFIYTPLISEPRDFFVLIVQVSATANIFLYLFILLITCCYTDSLIARCLC